MVSLTLFLSSTNSIATFIDFSELDYQYDIEESEWNIQHGSLSTSSTGINIGENNHPVGSSYDVHITDDAPDMVNYTISIGADSVTNTDTNSNDTITDLIILPAYLVDINETWDQVLFDKGPPMIFGNHFFDLDSINNLFEHLDENPSINSLAPPYHFAGGSYIATFEKKDSKGIFEFATTQDMYENDSGIVLQVDGKIQVKIEYDLTTGVLNGYHLFLDYSGTYAGTILDFFIHQQIEAKGYRMEKFLWNDGLPGFGIIITIPTLITISAISFYFNQRRKKK